MIRLHARDDAERGEARDVRRGDVLRVLDPPARIARSPMACTKICNPAASAPRTIASICAGGVTKKPESVGASVKGASIAAVCEPSEPSAKPLSAPMRSHASPRPRAATVSRSRSHEASGTAA